MKIISEIVAKNCFVVAKTYIEGMGGLYLHTMDFYYNERIKSFCCWCKMILK